MSETSNKKSKVALVTGGTGGIGTAICQNLAQQGFRVAASYNKGGDHDSAGRWQQAQKALGFDFAIAYGDVSVHESSAILVASIEEMLGPVAVLVNNAGITQDSSLRKMTPSQWHEVINTNLNSVYHLSHAVLPSMLAEKFGRIINIGSINGQKGQFGQANYAAAKAGMHGFTQSLALEVARKGITVNTVCPGYIDTPMLAKLPEKTLDAIIAQIPLGRLGTPDEVAHLVGFLADERSAFITGAELSVNGGQYL